MIFKDTERGLVQLQSDGKLSSVVTWGLRSQHGTPSSASARSRSRGCCPTAGLEHGCLPDQTVPQGSRGPRLPQRVDRSFLHLSAVTATLSFLPALGMHPGPRCAGKCPPSEPQGPALQFPVGAEGGLLQPLFWVERCRLWRGGASLWVPRLCQARCTLTSLISASRAARARS